VSLFVCDKCESIENTALAGFRGYHGRRMALTEKEATEHPDWVEEGLGDGTARCSSCNPEVGCWHGHWKAETFDPEKDGDRVINRG
jgi:hypothetical protein